MSIENRKWLIMVLTLWWINRWKLTINLLQGNRGTASDNYRFYLVMDNEL